MADVDGCHTHNLFRGILSNETIICRDSFHLEVVVATSGPSFLTSGRGRCELDATPRIVFGRFVPKESIAHVAKMVTTRLERSAITIHTTEPLPSNLCLAFDLGAISVSNLGAG